jgi:hypothetical protein
MTPRLLNSTLVFFDKCVKSILQLFLQQYILADHDLSYQIMPFNTTLGKLHLFHKIVFNDRSYQDLSKHLTNFQDYLSPFFGIGGVLDLKC